MTHDKSQWGIMTHDESQWGIMTHDKSQWGIMTQKMRVNKELWHTIRVKN